MKRFVAMLTNLVVLTSPGLGATNEIQLDMQVISAGEVALKWMGLAGTYGYAAKATASLDDTWRYVPPVDLWPIAGTGCTVTVDADAGFMRVVAANRGRLISSYKLIGSMSAAAIRQMERSIFKIEPTAIYDVSIYQLIYETFDHRGISTLALGAVAVPTGPGLLLSGPLVSYQHGTLFKKVESPSNTDSGDHSIGYLMAGDGYIVSMPDYVGLGEGALGLHPYVHARSEAVASVDLLRAVKTFLFNNQMIQPNGQCFIFGYSQGGHATMALQREIELHHATEFPLTASAPMAGPYDLSNTMADSMIQPVQYSGREYVPYLLFAYDAIYDLYESVSDVLVSPYDITLLSLFDGTHSGNEIDAAMPRIPREIFQPAWINDFTTNSLNSLRSALEANDLYRDWVPETPTRLYHCSGDEIVPFQNAVVAQSNFVARGAASVQLVDMGSYTHSRGFFPCIIAAKQWLDSLR
ncbi:lipase family protein [Pontiella sulfatireligans]|uniref:Inactive lipase n=1 Tax=Pontiella sulfatireligans TaxID=2750658 RepID=A0A6C2UMN1_9BACT|nr:lipase family protein [Pontiella sulfatireligans]VGO21542.1 hypothetical protein SCARR_03616 [Pontiella sulfatireligans]